MSTTERQNEAGTRRARARSGAARGLLFSLAVAALAATSSAQERRPIEIPGAGANDARGELEQLFAKVEKRLGRMSELLGEASAGDTAALKRLGGAGIDELIREAERPPSSSASAGIGALIEATQSHGRVVLEEIDRVLEIAREQAQQQQQQQQQSGGGGQQPPQPGGQQPQQGQTPENSQQMQGEQAPRPGQDQQPKPQDGEDPSSNRDNPPVTPEQNADAPPGADVGRPSGSEDAGEWGDLPVHVRRVFRNGVSDDVPPRYRDWIDAYHKKLSKRAPR